MTLQNTQLAVRKLLALFSIQPADHTLKQLIAIARHASYTVKHEGMQLLPQMQNVFHTPKRAMQEVQSYMPV